MVVKYRRVTITLSTAASHSHSPLPLPHSSSQPGCTTTRPRGLVCVSFTVLWLNLPRASSSSLLAWGRTALCVSKL
eukprot:scaffold274126_cov31-Tisochrysis_lutea.AAC.1